MLKFLVKKLHSKRGEGVVTGILWLGVVGIVAGAIATAMWKGIGDTAMATDTSMTTAGTSADTAADTAAAAIIAH